MKNYDYTAAGNGKLRKKRDGQQSKGAQNSNALYTDLEVKSMREFRQFGLTYEELGKLFNCAKSTAAHICKGRTYADSPGPIAPGGYQQYNTSKRVKKVKYS